MDFDQNLHMHCYRQDVGWDCCTVIKSGTSSNSGTIRHLTSELIVIEC